MITSLSSARKAADYEAQVSFGVEEASAFVDDAKTFLDAVLGLLRSEG